MMARLILTSLILHLWLAAPVFGQHEQPEQHSFHRRSFRVALLMGHTLIPGRHSKERLLIPSWGVDLEYWFSPKWGAGLHNDLELQSFVFEKEEDEIIEREYPLVTTLDVLYNPWKGLVLLAGPGVEFEKTENYFLFRMGLEYEIHLGNGWDLSPNFFYDSRDKVYDTWSFGIGVGKMF